jgi:hypothetical protein
MYDVGAVMILHLEVETSTAGSVSLLSLESGFLWQTEYTQPACLQKAAVSSCEQGLRLKSYQYSSNMGSFA